MGLFLFFGCFQTRLELFDLFGALPPVLSLKIAVLNLIVQLQAADFGKLLDDRIDLFVVVALVC